MSEKDNGNTTEVTTPLTDTNGVETLSQSSFWNKMMQGYYPNSYWSLNPGRPDSERRITKGEMVAAVIKGAIHRVLSNFWDQAARACVFVSLCIFVLFLGAWLYNAFMPMVHATVAAVLGLAGMIKAAVLWLRFAGTAMFGGFLGVGIFSVIALALNDEPGDLLTELSENVIFAIGAASLWVVQSVIGVVSSAALAVLGENVHGKLAVPYRWLEKKLITPVIVEYPE